MRIPRSAFTKDFQYTQQLLQRRPYVSESGHPRLVETARLLANVSIDNPPKFCCNSLCKQCTYLIWMDALLHEKKFDGPKISAKVLSVVQDIKMRKYLADELRKRGYMQ